MSLTKSVSVTFWYKCGAKEVPAPGADMQLTPSQLVALRRNLERAVATQLGPPRVHDFFAAVLRDTAEQDFPEATAHILGLLVLVMAPEKAPGFLHEIAAGRYDQ